MGKFLIKLFIKDYENTSDPIVRERYGKFAGVIGIISNVISASSTTKVWALWMARSPDATRS